MGQQIGGEVGMTDMINHPKHYTQASVQLEPIDVLRHAPFDLGNCLKYILRAGHKGDALEDWKKAEKYYWWAKETYGDRCEHYDDFFRNHFIYLQKFKVFEYFGHGTMYTFLDELGVLIEDNIRSITNKNL